jgi:hypothetical protein
MAQTASALLAVAVLLTASAAQAEWVWQKPTMITNFTTEGLKVEGLTPCRATINGEVFLGAIKDGKCEVKNNSSASTLVARPGFEFLTATAGIKLEKVMASEIPGAPRGAVRANTGEQGPLLCFLYGALGWHDKETNKCRIPGSAASTPGTFWVVVDSPPDGMVDLPPLWQDVSAASTGVINFGFCRASLTAGGAKTAPGSLSMAGGGKCTYVSSIDASGVPTFAQTTDKSRFVALLVPTSSTNKLEMFGIDTDARLYIGGSGNDKMFGCHRPAIGTLPNATGLLVRSKCYAAPTSGAGAGTLLPGTISRFANGLRVLSVFSRW